MEVLAYIILIFIAASSILIGFFLFLNPYLSIRIQQKFYERINWRIEPISMSKEIRNTKFMGLFLLFLSFLVMVHIIIKIIP
jgi:hypothetical protein